ncbi:hypothetical protein AO721_01420 [Aeromonas veronii]|nr:hypothetical protein AO728_01235 [Aeromonas veronii]KRV79027.1 hypothetical protein AO719_01235 [Aeromonas veronii]KRV90631.1 hypothetical protein AO721_01420 [Aeromonas veronii]KRV91909.1 hypothetical protein AO739_00625 [Aeromonas veronii]
MTNIEIAKVITIQLLSLNHSIYSADVFKFWIFTVHKRVVNRIFEYNLVIPICQYKTNAQVPFIYLV